MEDSGLVIAVILYLGMVALAVGWFLLPRWIFGPKAMTHEKARLERDILRDHSEMPGRRQRALPNWE